MGRGEEGRKRLQTNPWILKTSVRQRTGLVIGWNSQTLLTCVDHRLREEGSACLEKFLAKRGFSRELRQYGGNPVVRRFVFRSMYIIAKESATLFSLFSFSDV